MYELDLVQGKVSKWDLFRALAHCGESTVRFFRHKTYGLGIERGILQSVEREDSSGSKFNLEVKVMGKPVFLYVETID